MKVYPKQIEYRPELNLRQGIKSSLPEIKALVALTFVIYEVNNRYAQISYNQSIEQTGETKIKEALMEDIQAFFAKQIVIKSKAKLVDEINKNPLNKAQLEALQVTLELFLKFGIIDFVEDFPATYERTGGKRYEKKLSFSTNLDLFRLVLTNSENQISEFAKNIFWNWIVGSVDFEEEKNILVKIQSFLTILTEETQFKIRKEGGEELYFQQEGIYKSLVDGNTVYEKDAHEPVGPFRIFKSFVNKDLHAFIKETSNGFESKVSNDELENYLDKVSTTLNIIPKRTLIIQEQNIDPFLPTIQSKFQKLSPLQKIYFGSPGTGKSRALENFAKENNLEVIRTTFHPDTDYHSFVGGYKPVMEDDKIVYKFVPQAFTKAYTLALQNPDKGFMLAIEEINRGNCASIFGDIFQCLDRNGEGSSTYKSEADAELGKYLESLGLGNKIILPPNLLLYATMNTSDQSLFPMDAAFKRRWEWEYVPIDMEDAAQISVRIDDETSFLWSDFIGKINKKIYEATKSDDKKLGNRFVNPKDENGTLIISKEQFVNKVMFYLWTEIYKDEHESGNTIFKTDDDTKFSYNELFKKAGEFDLALLTNFLKYNGIVE